MLDCDTSPQF